MADHTTQIGFSRLKMASSQLLSPREYVAKAGIPCRLYWYFPLARLAHGLLVECRRARRLLGTLQRGKSMVSGDRSGFAACDFVLFLRRRMEALGGCRLRCCIARDGLSVRGGSLRPAIWAVSPATRTQRPRRERARNVRIADHSFTIRPDTISALSSDGSER